MKPLTRPKASFSTLPRSREQHLARAALEVTGGIVPGAELGGLDHDLGAEVAPVDFRGVAVREDRDRPAADLDRACGVADRPLEATIGRIELEQMRQGSGVGDVVDRNDLDLFELQ